MASPVAADQQLIAEKDSILCLTYNGVGVATAQERQLTISVGDGQVSGLLVAPAGACACYVLAHGAGVGMRHKFMAETARGLAERGIATLRYQFPYMERGSKRPDSPKVAQAAVRAAAEKARELLPGLPLIAGGKSYGARMTSQARAEAALPGVRGLAFLGFPLHAPGQPSDDRAEHLSRVETPMLFLQGTRDEFAQLDLLKPLVERLGARATLKLFEGADHSFHVPAKSGRTDADLMSELLDSLAEWIREVVS
ncbi:MAG: dienelactone hydrolase family protein [Alphaproteobacteria bacterium]|nr:dienelactone hydrolase family protein [Alphaproteobacteria bacterium]